MRCPVCALVERAVVGAPFSECGVSAAPRFGDYLDGVTWMNLKMPRRLTGNSASRYFLAVNGSLMREAIWSSTRHGHVRRSPSTRIEETRRP